MEGSWASGVSRGTCLVVFEKRDGRRAGGRGGANLHIAAAARRVHWDACKTSEYASIDFFTTIQTSVLLFSFNRAFGDELLRIRSRCLKVECNLHRCGPLDAVPASALRPARCESNKLTANCYAAVGGTAIGTPRLDGWPARLVPAEHRADAAYASSSETQKHRSVA